MRVLKENTAAIIIDIQERLYPHMHEKEEFAAKVITLVLGLQQLNIPIIVSQQYTVGLGHTIEAVREAIENYSFLEKIAFSCYDEPSFKDAFAGLGKKFIIVAGLESHVCVLQTALDLLADGYIPVLVEDCISSRREHDKTIALARMRSEGAIITTCESILFELCRCAGTDEFRNISRLVK